MITASRLTVSFRLAQALALAAGLSAGISVSAFADDAVLPAAVPLVSENAAILVAPGAIAPPAVEQLEAVSSNPAAAGGTEELTSSPLGGPGGDCPHHRRKLVLVPTS